MTQTSSATTAAIAGRDIPFNRFGHAVISAI
jgi:hypothetical protein